MTDYVSNTTIHEVANILLAAKSCFVTTHANVDGDALGSVLAIRRALRDLGKHVDASVIGDIPPNLAAFMREDEVTVLESDPASAKYDCLIVADTGAISQVHPIHSWLAQQRDRIVILDHHVRGDLQAEWKLLDSSCASTTQLIVAVLRAMEVTITAGPFGIAEALFLGLATDTGWFKFNNADADAFSCAAELLRCGADKSRIFSLSEENNRPERLAITARALASLRVICGGRAAIMLATRGDFDETGATQDDLSGVVNDPMSVGSVLVSAILSEVDSNLTKISFRSKPAVRINGGIREALDVNQIAATFGGGGHVHAAGARVARPLSEVTVMVEKALADAVMSSTKSDLSATVRNR